MSNDRTTDMIMLSFLFLGLPVVFIALIQGLFYDVVNVSFGIPNTPLQFHWGFNLLTLGGSMILIMFAVIVALFALQFLSGVKILGSGGGQISDGLILTTIQWSFVLTMLAFLTVVILAQFPSYLGLPFGLLYSGLWSLVGLAGVVLHLKGVA